MGVIDCTEDCPGTEEEFKHFREVMEDPDFAKKFPKISAMSKKPEKKPMIMDNEEAESGTKPKRDVKADFLASLSNCKDFSEDTLALLSLATGDGMKFGAISDDPNDNTYVAPGATSNISQIEYDYSDYYDDEETETSKKRRDVEDTKESKQVNVLKIETKVNKKEDIMQDVTVDKVKKPLKDKTVLINKKDYFEKQNGLDDEDIKHISEEDKINMNMIRSVNDELELTNISITVGDNITEVLVEENVTETEPELVEELSRRVKREVDEVRSLFHRAVRMVRDGTFEEKSGKVLRIHATSRMLKQIEERSTEDKLYKDNFNIQSLSCFHN